jgi:hypothetical protein
MEDMNGGLSESKIIVYFSFTLLGVILDGK